MHSECVQTRFEAEASESNIYALGVCKKSVLSLGIVMPINYYLYLIGLVILYFLIVTFVKKIYIKRNGEWL